MFYAALVCDFFLGDFIFLFSYGSNETETKTDQKFSTVKTGTCAKCFQRMATKISTEIADVSSARIYNAMWANVKS